MSTQVSTPTDNDPGAGGDEEEKFIEGICLKPTLSATNGVQHVDIVPKRYEFNALGEREFRSRGIWAGPVVVRPIYCAIYEEIKYREKYGGGTATLSEDEIAYLTEVRSRFEVAGGNLQYLLCGKDLHNRAVEQMKGKVKLYFEDAESKIPVAPDFVTNVSFYGSILHIIPNENPTGGSPLGLVNPTIKWASPYEENLAIDQVLQNANDFADRFATVVSKSKTQVVLQAKK